MTAPGAMVRGMIEEIESNKDGCNYTSPIVFFLLHLASNKHVTNINRVWSGLPSRLSFTCPN